MEHDLLLETINSAVRQGVKETVNGKIDALSVKLDAHIKTVEPILQGLEASKFVGKTTLWISGAIVAVGSAYVVIRQIITGV